MRSKAELTDITLDYETRKVKATFLLSDATAAQVERLKGKELMLEAKKYRADRSIDQNAYMWELLQAIADHARDGSSRWEHYLRCIREYGVFTTVAVPEETVEGLRPLVRVLVDRGGTVLTTESGKRIKARQVQLFKGTSKYTTEEMSNLLDRIIDECKAAGIDVMTPEEREHMRSLSA